MTTKLHSIISVLYNYIVDSTRAALKVMPPILLYLPTISEVDVGGMAVAVEPSHQYSVTCRCCVTDGSRGAVWQNGVWHGSACEAEACHWIPGCGKNDSRWHSPTLAERFWSPNSGCEHSEVVGGVFQQWRQWHEKQTTFSMAMQTFTGVALVHCWWKCVVNGGDYVEK